jgi:hypothetical protein
MDTITTLFGDSVTVYLSAGITQWGHWHTFIDLCTLEKLD